MHSGSFAPFYIFYCVLLISHLPLARNFVDIASISVLYLALPEISRKCIRGFILFTFGFFCIIKFNVCDLVVFHLFVHLTLDIFTQN